MPFCGSTVHRTCSVSGSCCGSLTPPIKEMSAPNAKSVKSTGEVMSAVGDWSATVTISDSVSTAWAPARSVAVSVMVWVPAESVLWTRLIPLTSGTTSSAVPIGPSIDDSHRTEPMSARPFPSAIVPWNSTDSLVVTSAPSSGDRMSTAGSRLFCLSRTMSLPHEARSARLIIGDTRMDAPPCGQDTRRRRPASRSAPPGRSER